MAKDSRSLEMELRSAKPGEDGTPSIIFIGDGLQLWTSRNRAGKVTKTWVLRYYDALGKRTKARIGKYPEISLKQAQAQAEDLKAKAKDGMNIAKVQAEAKRIKIEGVQATAAANENTFVLVAEMWLEKRAYLGSLVT